MNFRNQEEITQARIATVLYLPQMLILYERELKGLGVRIVEKFFYKSDDGLVDPVCRVEAGGRRFEFRLGNALREFLSIDRDENPMRFDWKLNDPDHAAEKLSRILTGRLEIARTFIECKTPEEMERRVEEMGRHFEKIRFWRIDLKQEGGK